ncbi:HNH endonuclease [Gracilibacillus oryzae]|uniref:HNH endonuclease n=1 Tax=Gracilibacillus oryzae TaxID=1672701 RepID=A0A7C8KW90_9BACI|nr:HNH endonuclease [Gracilibacillus oryzae]KAB8126928.1 HNH endonuclease [Gracilibacillus oryzae]
MTKIGEYLPYSKQQQVGRKRKKQNRDFSPKVKKEIFERDQWRCVKCGSYYLEEVPHHIIFKSQGGSGEKRNGAAVCINCHRSAHRKDEVRRWFENWRDKYLDQNGDLL